MESSNTNVIKQGMRFDAALVARGIVSSRQRAKNHILNGEVKLNGRIVKKADAKVFPDDILLCEGEILRYVGRGGSKLEKALSVGNYDIHGLCTMDVGASTGGFTDCMLQNGAKFVYAIDVGHGQLHPRLALDERVCNLEGTDIRKTEQLMEKIPRGIVSFCSIDVSFISVKKVLGNVLSHLKPNADIVCLIKPQFEAGRSAVGKNGVVKDAKIHRRVIDDLCAFFASQGCYLRDLTFSPVTGGDGNIEYLALLRYGSSNNIPNIDSSAVVKAAHQALKG